MITKSLFQLASAFWVIHDITNIGSTYLRKKANECNCKDTVLLHFQCFYAPLNTSSTQKAIAE